MQLRIDIKVLASGSTGNCYMLRGVESNLLLECGLSLKKIRTTLKDDLFNIAGVIVSHEHADHSKSANDFANLGFNIYASAGTLDKIDVEKSYNTNILEDGLKQGITEEWDVLPFGTQHDAEEPLGFLIYNTITKERLAFITDTYYVEYKFANLDYLMVECNYDYDYVIEHMEEIPHSKRLLLSHMSYQNCLKLIKANDMSKMKKIFLIHMSDRHGNAHKFKEGITALTGKVVVVA